MPGRMIAILTAVFLIVTLPLTAVLSGVRGSVRDKVRDDTSRFLETIREEGVITSVGLFGFEEKAAHYLDDFKLDISVGRRVDFVTGGTAVRGENAGGVRAIATAVHTHCDACFKGHNHAVNGCTVHEKHTDSCYVTEECDGEMSGGGRMLERRCNKCDADLAMAIYEYEGGMDVFQRWVGIYNCGCNAGYYTTYRYVCKKCKKNYEFGGSGAFRYRKVCGRVVKTLVCGLEPGYYSCGITTSDNEPVCDRVITGIGGRDQVVFLGDETGLDKMVKVTYLDGHTAGVEARATGLDAGRPGNYRVKLKVDGFVGSAKNTGTAEAEVEVLVIPRTKTCPNGHEYELNEKGIDEGCPLCQSTLHRIYPLDDYIETEYGVEGVECVIFGEFLDGSTRKLNPEEYTTDFDPLIPGLQNVEVRAVQGEVKTHIKVYNLKLFMCETCHRPHEAMEDGSDGGCPFCKGEITQIRVVPQKTELKEGEELEVIVYAVYGDREERIYEEWTSDYDPHREGTQNVTVICLDMSCEISVTVAGTEEKTCPACGEKYDKDEDHCPSCRKTVSAIAVKEKEGEILYVGEQPEFEIEVTYEDGTTSKVTDGYYLDGYDPGKNGRQSVTVSYEGYTATVTVMVWTGLPGYRDCGKGHLYLPLFDGEPCPYCEEDPESDSSYEIVYGMDEILEMIGREGRFELAEGDAVSVSIIWGERMGRFMLFGGGRQKASYCGGFVFDERWGDGD